MNTIAHPHPDPPPGHTQNASAFCVGTRPLRASPCRGGGEPAEYWQRLVFASSAGYQHTFQDTFREKSYIGSDSARKKFACGSGRYGLHTG